MPDCLQFYIDGHWENPLSSETIVVINPATEEPIGRIASGTSGDIDRAVAAARRAFPGFARATKQDRIALIESVMAEYARRETEIASIITEEVGAPANLSRHAQAMLGRSHFQVTLDALREFKLEEQRGRTRLVREPIGVCGLITPWNWPINQIAAKVAPALAAGCSMVLKPSEVAPFNACIFAEILHAAGVPPGVFNLVNGHGPVVGDAIARHPDVAMVSFTGSTRAGIEVARNAAATVKRVHQELGGKSPNIILDGPQFAEAVKAGVRSVFVNSGQSCNVPSRMLVPDARKHDAIRIATGVAQKCIVGDPRGNAHMGPVVSEAQWLKVQSLIAQGIREGATLIAGGVGRPDGLDRGYFVKPTVFADVTNDMAIARTEIFGPVLSILTYRTIDEAVAIANDTEYGLAAYVSGPDDSVVQAIAGELRAGQVNLNSSPRDPTAPFGGYKMSGNGREWGDHGLAEYLEVKAMIGAMPKA